MNTHALRAKNLRLSRAAAAVLTAMRNGQTLHLEFRQTGARWRLSGGEQINTDVARLVVINPDVIGDDDALFPGASTPQTFHMKESSR
jgi:predicted ABC-type transport system involved in lysophospholipase L1 biosynthesis ATPase subunit